MDFTETGKRYRLYLPWLLVALLAVILVAPLGSRAGALRRMTAARPLPTATPAVAYGASLAEWEEATQAEPDPATEDAVHTSGIVEQAPDPAGQTSDAVEQTSSVEEQGSSGTEPDTAAASASTAGVPFTANNVVYQEMFWDGLLPADYSADAIMEKYAPQLAEYEDGSEEAMDLYLQMQEEFNNAPVNDLLDGTMIRLPGFIAPLNYADEFITEFLLVPYFGACIHVPPPPVNQTVLVNAGDGQGIKAEDSFLPVWVMGRLATEGTSTSLADAGYRIQDAIIEPYVGP